MRRALQVAFACALLVGTAGAAQGRSEGRTYVVERGDSLSAIAARWTGDPQRWEELYRANRDQIKDPSLLYPGQRLVILDRWPEPAEAASDGREVQPLTE